MPKFRKKPVVIEAVEFPGYANGWFEAVDTVPWLEEAYENDVLANVGTPPYLVVKTLEGKMTVSPGDWIIRGVKGELYPCKPDVFEATYEKVDE